MKFGEYQNKSLQAPFLSYTYILTHISENKKTTNICMLDYNLKTFKN
jgi:hypothetical protein